MLYPRKNDKTLSKELFRNPTSEYRGAPFWAWNCKLEEKELLWQLEVLKQMGMGGAHMHVRTGMETPYLSDEYMALVKTCVEKCKKEKMFAWLYDEDRWPSGSAGGIVTKDEQYRERYIRFTVNQTSDENSRLISCYDIRLDKNGCLESATPIEPEQNCFGTKWYVYMEIAKETPWHNNQTYVNTLDKAAIKRFIDVTYERYFETVGEDFGSVVPAIFTDEPQFTRKGNLGFAKDQKDVILPWTDDLPQTFKAAYGEDLVENLPQLLWELPDGQVSSVRYHYHDHICERFVQALADQSGEWCDKHGLMLTGHLMGEGRLGFQSYYVGEAMRSYRGFQLPGIDVLGNNFEFTTAKQAQSVSRQYNREGVLSEPYGITSWDFDFRGHKAQGDWQAALGVTVRVHHLSWVSMKGAAKRDYPASINYQAPWWKDYTFVENHFSRVNTAMTRGKAVVRLGVIHPIESYWLHMGSKEQTLGIRTQMDQNFQDLTNWLLCGSMDFDFISEALLPEQCAVGSAPLQVGAMAYDTIIVPGCETLRSSTLQRLEAFVAAGGRLIFLGSEPKYENAVSSNRGKALWEKAIHINFSREALLEELEVVRLVDIRNADGSRTSNLLHQLRQDGDDRWLFIAHSQMPYHRDIPEYQKIRICLEGEYSVDKYDTQTGDIVPIKSVIENGKTIVTAELYDLDSLLLRYKAEQEIQQPEVATKPATQIVKTTVPYRVPYTLDAPNMYLLDKAEFALNDEPYEQAKELLRADTELRTRLGWPLREAAAAQPWAVRVPEPEHKVRLRFTVFCAVDVPNVKFALEDADVATIRFNGTAVTAKPDGWYVDKSIQTVPIGTLRKGENTIEIILPFGQKTNVEWCYLLGDFGVRVFGEYREIVEAPSLLGFGDVTLQGLVHYCGNITYYLDVETVGGDVTITVPHYAGAAVRVEIDDKKEYIAYPPYKLNIGNLSAGKHTLKLTLLGNCHNGFGPLHWADLRYAWSTPSTWHSKDSRWTECYRLRELGFLSPPIIEERRP